MKLDKIKFAKVVAYIGGAIARGNFDSTDVDVLDDMIDIPESEPQVVPGKADAQQVDRLLELMAQGQQKIEAIKVYRAITGMGLKDSKDAVEKYWPVERKDARTKEQLLAKLSNTPLQQLDTAIIEGFIKSL